MPTDPHQALENQLAQAKREAIGVLASRVGHDLRSPLAVIQNTIYFLKTNLKNDPDKRLGEMMALAETEVQNANHLISDLLDFARPVKLSMFPADLNGLVQETFKALKAPKGVTIELDLAGDPPKAAMDYQKMRQVLGHLAANAFQAMLSGGTLRVITKVETRSDAVGRWAAFELKDTGEGISPENLDSIFEPLFTTRSKGAGLGLAICRAFVEGHGGHIQVESTLGRGAAFTVRLPAL